jgi:hypothetical protein
MAGPTPQPAAQDPAKMRKPWQALVLTRAQELRFILVEKVTDPVQHAAIERHLDEAELAATSFRRRGLFRRPPRETAVERAFGELDAAEASLLRAAPDAYVLGQLPSIVAQVRSHLPRGDERLERLMAIEQRQDGTAATATKLPEEDRTAVITAFRASALESRRELARVHNLSVLLYGIAVALTIGAVALGLVGLLFKSALPLCFTPDDAAVVCPVRAESAKLTTTTGGDQPATRNETEVTKAIGRVTSRGDVALVELLGLVAAGIAAAAALRRLEGTSTPFNLPCAAAVLKLPTGALTAVLGLVLMRGDFVPGLSALDNSAQILAWAALFGYAQELFTRFADARAQTVLGKVGTPGDQKQPDGTTVPSVTAG